MSDQLPGTPVPFSLPNDFSLETRVANLERLVLEITKHVSPAAHLPPGAVFMIEDLKRRYPDV